MSGENNIISTPEFPDLEGLTLDELDAMRAKLLGGRNDFDELTEDELERFVAINAKMRLTARVASKPAANGGRKAKSSAPEKSLDELLGIG